MYHVGFDAGSPGSEAMYAGGASNWYGPAIWQSHDRGQTWTHSSEGLTYGDDGPEITQVWCVTPAQGALYAGVEPAGLFKSGDGGASWQHVAGLRRHPSLSEWQETTGGLCLHAVVPHPDDPQQLWVAISSGGVFHTGDGGESWERCATPIEPVDLLAGAAQPGQDGRQLQPLHPCVHALALAPSVRAAESAAGRDEGSSVRLYQQNHHGVYRSDDGGQHWLDVSGGLPSRFGFPLAVHPRDPHTVYVVPLESDEPGRRHVPGGNMAVWRSRDAGAHWQSLANGLPQERTAMSVLRGALAVDPLDPAGVYLGTTTGQVFWSADEGETWRMVPARLPPIYSLAAMPV